MVLLKLERNHPRAGRLLTAAAAQRRKMMESRGKKPIPFVLSFHGCQLHVREGILEKDQASPKYQRKHT